MHFCMPMDKLIIAKAFGFWKNTSEKFPDITDFISSDKMKNAEAFAQYLNNGSCIVASPGMTKCFLCGAMLGPESINTDGVWIWPSTLSHFVIEHKVHLPAAFSDTIEQKQFIMPDVTEEQRTKVDDEWGKAYEEL